MEGFLEMEKVKNTIGYIAIFLFILTFAIAFTINFTPLYAFDISYLNIEETVGLPKEVILENYRILMKYLNLPWVTQLSMPDFPSSASGLFHFYEVKVLFMLNYGVFVISGILAFLFLRKKVKDRRMWQLIRPAQMMAIIPLVILFFIAVNFRRIFLLFHEVFFNNDAWIFDWRTDPIILALPQDFFMHCFILVFVIMEIGLWGLYFWSKRKSKATYH